MRSGIGLDCNVAYREIPICSGYDDEGNWWTAMIQNGFLNVLVQLDKMVDYWHHMLKEFPDHPAASMDHAVKLRFYVMNFKGDWKYLVQLFNFRKNPSTEKVCWKCEATKGNTDMTNAYTDVAEHAPWKATLWTSLPWPISEVPELTKVTGFDVKMISADLLHTWHLGCGRDLAGSCIKVLVGLRYFHGRSIERSLAQATVQLKRFAKLHKHSLVLRKLTKANLNWSDYPELRCKGFDTFVVLAWLQHEFSARPPTADDPELQSKLDLMTTAVWCMDSLMRMLAHSGMHLSEMQQRQKTILGSIYMNCYMTLAQKAIEDGKKLWREFERVWLGNRRLTPDENFTSSQSPLRRLAFNVPSASVAKKNVKEAQMSCASQINGIISSLLYVDQYVSDSVYTCPPPNKVDSLYPAKCSMSIGVLVGGVAKAAAALSDIAVECKNPTSTLVPYSKQPEAGREDVSRPRRDDVRCCGNSW
ncbi:unnamed protein product [Cladocopium goreaui]|uniref:Kinesin light chain 2 n=1 Tax=Cladocopium goreaui TaxID=2562237 RepID=A0A9P1GQR8_9DINO|nr:unnamed protein product [Cladocopium goreaui]